jgi:hypothetical protein
MATLPIPIRAALGLAATAIEEARKLPETLPQAVTTVPMIAMSTAMQASMRVQQHIATLAARGDEVLIRLQGSSAEPPSWATFDDELPTSEPVDATGQAAFDKIDYEHTGFSEGDDGASRWGAVGVSDDSAAPRRKPRAKANDVRKPPVVGPKKTASRAARTKKSTVAEDLAAEAAHIDE